MRFSVDSNILVYAIDTGGGAHHETARDFMARAAKADCILVLQSLAEFFYATTRKGKLAADKAAAFMDRWTSIFPVHCADPECLADAIAAVRQHRLSFGDALLWATVRKAGFRLLFSEALQDGRTLRGVTFVNPFAAKNAVLIDAILPGA
jgi:predicted nucleic acid-binding protein